MDGYENITQLCEGIIVTYLEKLQIDKVSAYDIIDMVVPQIEGDLKTADRQNKVLSKKDRKALEHLLSFSQNQLRLHNQMGGFVLIGK